MSDNLNNNTNNGNTIENPIIKIKTEWNAQAEELNADLAEKYTAFEEARTEMVAAFGEYLSAVNSALGDYEDARAAIASGVNLDNRMIDHPGMKKVKIVSIDASLDIPRLLADKHTLIQNALYAHQYTPTNN